MSYLQVVAENQELRRRNKELEEKIFLYMESGMANISRASFRNYVMAELGRKESDAEWRHFISTFSYDISPMNEKVYAWIERYLRKPVLKVVFEEWPTDW
jgi:Ca2+-binding EF-hand superfamily protein